MMKKFKPNILTKVVAVVLLSVCIMSLTACSSDKQTDKIESTTKKAEQKEVSYTVRMDTSEYTDAQVEDIISEIRAKAGALNAEAELGPARYNEVEFIVTCYYTDKPMTENELKQILFMGYKVVEEETTTE